VSHFDFNSLSVKLTTISRQGLNYARPKLKAGFMRHRELRGENVEKALEKGEFIYKGMYMDEAIVSC
jgi:hypothetical protein